MWMVLRLVASLFRLPRPNSPLSFSVVSLHRVNFRHAKAQLGAANKNNNNCAMLGLSANVINGAESSLHFSFSPFLSLSHWTFSSLSVTLLLPFNCKLLCVHSLVTFYFFFLLFFWKATHKAKQKPKNDSCATHNNSKTTTNKKKLVY